MNKERIADVLVEHFFHNAEPAGDLWSVECNCGMALVAVDLPAAERRFAAHQASTIEKEA